MYLPYTSHYFSSAFKDYFSTLYILICVSVNMYVQPSSHSFPMNNISPDWSCGKMCAVLDLVDNKGMGFSYAI